MPLLKLKIGFISCSCIQSNVLSHRRKTLYIYRNGYEKQKVFYHKICICSVKTSMVYFLLDQHKFYQMFCKCLNKKNEIEKDKIRIRKTLTLRYRYVSFFYINFSSDQICSITGRYNFHVKRKT